MKKFKVKICGDLWEVRLYPTKVFTTQFTDCLAITHYHHNKKLRTMTFCYRHRDIDTIVHEVTHAYLSYFDFSQMSYGAIEEKFCEILGKKLRHIAKVSKTIRRRLYSLGK